MEGDKQCYHTHKYINTHRNQEHNNRASMDESRFSHHFSTNDCEWNVPAKNTKEKLVLLFLSFRASLFFFTAKFSTIFPKNSELEVAQRSTITKFPQ